MQVLLAVWVAGATRQSTDLVTSGAGFDAATSSLVVGGGSASGWGAMKVEDLTASTGTKIVFKWGNGHNVVMTNEAAFTGCKLGDGDSKCLATDGTANAVAGACEQGGNVVTKGTDNKYTYEAVMTSAGEYYFICGVPGHCGSQKVKVTVTDAATGGGAEMSSSALITSTAALAGAPAFLTIGADPGSAWGGIHALPKTSQEVTVGTGTKLVFKWSYGHNVVMTTAASYGTCALEAAGSVCLATDGTAEAITGDCKGPYDKYMTAVNSLGTKYTYEAVASKAGVYYFICAVPGHCARGQKVKVTVTDTPPSGGTTPGSPASASPPPAESAEDSAAASLGSGALGTAMLVTATTALLRGLLF